MKLLKCGCYQMDREVTKKVIVEFLEIEPDHNWREIPHDVKACIKSNKRMLK